MSDFYGNLTPQSSSKVDNYKEITLVSGFPPIFPASKQSKAAMLPSLEGMTALSAAGFAASSQHPCGTKGKTRATRSPLHSSFR
jgi:hypothetical protein